MGAAAEAASHRAALARRNIPEFPDLPLREVVVPPHYHFCTVRATPCGNAVWVVAVWHAA